MLSQQYSLRPVFWRSLFGMRLELSTTPRVFSFFAWARPDERRFITPSRSRAFLPNNFTIKWSPYHSTLFSLP